MVEHAVENHLDTSRACVGHQLLEEAITAEVVTDLEEVARIVAMIRSGFEDRIEVDDRDANALQIIELIVHTLQIAAEIIAPLRRLGAWRGRHVIGPAEALWQLCPLLVDDLR